VRQRPLVIHLRTTVGDQDRSGCCSRRSRFDRGLAAQFPVLAARDYQRPSEW
jgi:hypothetical protein